MALADRLATLDVPGTVVPSANWHITLRFIGRTDDVAYDRLLGSLDEADLGRVFDIGLADMGAFPRPKSATVLWLGVAKGQTRLEEVAAVVEEAVQAAGFGAEERPFRAHLTLSRIRPPVDVTGLIGSFPDAGLVWRCRSIVVYRSHLGRGGARYEPLETFPLAR
jgi:2'-5' RNA ligase